MATIANVTYPANPPVELLPGALDNIEGQRDVIVARYGEDYYNQLYAATERYFSTGQFDPILGNSFSFDDLQVTGNPSSSSLYFDESRAVMRKIPNSMLGITEEREIRPYLRRLPNETPMFLRIVDSNFQPYGIIMSSGWAVTALKLCPNAESIAINSAKIVNRYQTMTRWVEEHWGDEIDVINLSGSTFSFFGYGLNGRFPGLVAESRSFTESYKWLKELSRLFTVDGFVLQDNRVYEGSIGSLRTEGFVSPAVEQFLSDPSNRAFVENHPREGLVKERLYMNFVFDYLSCYGYIDTFDIVDSSTSPYRMTYTLVFKSEKTIYRQGSPSGSI